MSFDEDYFNGNKSTDDFYTYNAVDSHLESDYEDRVGSMVMEDSWDAEIYEHEWDLWDDMNEE